jgi:hypothetical protein
MLELGAKMKKWFYSAHRKEGGGGVQIPTTEFTDTRMKKGICNQKGWCYDKYYLYSVERLN